MIQEYTCILQDAVSEYENEWTNQSEREPEREPERERHRANHELSVLSQIWSKKAISHLEIKDSYSHTACIISRIWILGYYPIKAGFVKLKGLYGKSSDGPQ